MRSRGEGHGCDRRIGNAEQRDIGIRHPVVATKRAEDAEARCTQGPGENAAETTGADDGDGRVRGENRGAVHVDSPAEKGGADGMSIRPRPGTRKISEHTDNPNALSPCHSAAQNTQIPARNDLSISPPSRDTTDREGILDAEGRFPASALRTAEILRIETEVLRWNVCPIPGHLLWSIPMSALAVDDRARYRANPTVLQALKSPRMLTREVLAGLVVGRARIPEAIAFSVIAGVDPQVGVF